MVVTETRTIRKYKYRIQEIKPLSLAAESVAGTNMTVFNILRIDSADNSWSHIGDGQKFYRAYDDAFKEVVELITVDDGMISIGPIKNIWEVS